MTEEENKKEVENFFNNRKENIKKALESMREDPDYKYLKEHMKIMAKDD